MNDFALALTYVLASEGGYVNDPQDPGGATDHGVTQHQYDLWRVAHGQKTRPVQIIDPSEVEAFYRYWYWNPIHADQLPSGVDYCTFDFAVNSGPHEAAVCLQRAVGAKPDGDVGAKTLAAVDLIDRRQVINTLCDERLAFMRACKNWQHDKNGWTARVAAVRQAALGMA